MGLFKKDREKVIKEAHGLIDKHNALDKKHQEIILEWGKEKRKATTISDAFDIDRKYEKLDKEYEKKEDELYDKYYYMMHKEFGDIPLESFKDLPDKFLDKKLVERLSKKKKK